ncbi:hypothetical protein ACO22_00087 [Paracoccidioides brasiliensis]|uniref:MOZ protein represents a chromatin-associated acetyltransferase n=1 Tax=Paracoccidioides brasiliensis TaxID=121759 RepID=A0A1D2JQA4_PARBR|nr:hypothetical protein ACO22_00087 [Paracoccidioides brasiliensis]
MAAPRLPFLYPNLFRSVRACEPKTYHPIRFPPSQPQQQLQKNGGSYATFHTSRRCDVEPFHQRYGQAAESRLPPPQRPKDGGRVGSQKGVVGKEPQQARDKARKKTEQSRESGSQDLKDSGKGTKPGSRKKQSSSSTNILVELSVQGDSGGVNVQNGTGSSGGSAPATDDPNINPLKGNQSSVFQMPGPNPSSSQQDESLTQITLSNGHHQLPHPSSLTYAHLFDTYSLVKDLGRSGFTEEQSVSIMKAIRGLLADNFEMAREGLVSKSDVENETYLFQAACSELRNSLQASRNAEIQAQRSQRVQLQHEVDILTQLVTQELAGLKDDLKEMFNDQKISTRELQRSFDTAIQELNYQITVSLNSDGKSEVEGLRWILTRRAALAIATSAGMIILALRYFLYKLHEKDQVVKGSQAESKTIPQPFPDLELKSNFRPESSVTEPIG